VLKSHNKLHTALTKNKILLQKRENTAFWPKTRQTRNFGKITAFDENHGFRDFRDFLLSLRKPDNKTGNIYVKNCRFKHTCNDDTVYWM